MPTKRARIAVSIICFIRAYLMFLKVGWSRAKEYMVSAYLISEWYLIATEWYARHSQR